MTASFSILSQTEVRGIKNRVLGNRPAALFTRDQNFLKFELVHARTYSKKPFLKGIEMIMET
jgi:hypothetical protein